MEGKHAHQDVIQEAASASATDIQVKIRTNSDDSRHPGIETLQGSSVG